MKTLHILNAGCVMSQVKDTVERFNALHSNIQAVNCNGGSVDCIRRMQSGEPCDLLILADDAIIVSMMIPDYTDGYFIFAGNRMVLVSLSDKKVINSDNWIEKLLDPLATFGHFDPSGDPGGYRAVMACMLADNVQPGLSEKLLEHPGRVVLNSPNVPQPDYMFTYYSGPAGRGKPFAQLPVEMDLSDPSLNEHYATAIIALEKDGTNIVHGSAICHALTIPYTSKEPEAVKSFINLFLQTDFQSQGFLPRSQMVGKWTASV